MSNTIKLTINPVTQKKLVLVRQLYQSAFGPSSSRYSPVSRIMAIIGFDLAVETILKTIVSILDTKEQPEKTFGSVLQQVNEKLRKHSYSPVPDEANIRFVHSLRNDAQHKVKYPTENDVVDCHIYVRDFLHKIMDDLLGIHFESISLVDLIQDDKAKEFLSMAEDALHVKNYEDAIRQAATGLTWAIDSVRRRLFRRRSSLNEELDFRDYEDVVEENLRDAIIGAYEPVRDEISNELDEIREALLSIALGLNYTQFVRLKLILPDEIHFGADGQPMYQRYLFIETINEEDAHFAFNYCVDAIIQIESQVGSLEAIRRSWRK